MPWIYKWNSVEGCLPGFFGTYIDDIQTGHSSEAGCKATTCLVSSRVNYLGQQDAARKWGQPAKVPHAWVGAKCVSIGCVGLFVLCTQEKWDKTKAIVQYLLAEIEDSEDLHLDYKKLEKDMAFSVTLVGLTPQCFLT